MLLLTSLGFIKIVYAVYLIYMTIGLVQTNVLMFKLIYSIGIILGLASLLFFNNLTFISIFLTIVYAGGILIFILFIFLFLRGTKTLLRFPLRNLLLDYRLLLLLVVVILYGINNEGSRISTNLLLNHLELILPEQLQYLFSKLSVINLKNYDVLLYVSEQFKLIILSLISPIFGIGIFFDEVLFMLNKWTFIIRQPTSLHWVINYSKQIVVTPEKFIVTLFNSTFSHIIVDQVNTWLRSVNVVTIHQCLYGNFTYIKTYRVNMNLLLDYSSFQLIQFMSYWFDNVIINWKNLTHSTGQGCLNFIPQEAIHLTQYFPTRSLVQSVGTTANGIQSIALFYYSIASEILLTIGLGLLYGVIGSTIFIKK